VFGCCRCGQRLHKSDAASVGIGERGDAAHGRVRRVHAAGAAEAFCAGQCAGNVIVIGCSGDLLRPAEPDQLFQAVKQAPQPELEQGIEVQLN
jgi:hypothetical protein